VVKSLEDVGAALVADSQAAETAEPSQSAFDDPAMPSQTLATLDAAPGDPRLDGAPAARSSALREIVALIGVQLGRSPAGPSPALAHRRHSIDQLFEEAAVVDIGRGESDGERDTPGVGDEVALAACPAGTVGNFVRGWA
jgi:hypothetical protein